MPQRTLRPCLSQPCPNLVISGRCPQHSLQRDNVRREQQQIRDHSGTRAQLRPFYWSKEWRELRAAFLAKHPMCGDCVKLDPPEYRLAQEVDHIIPISRGGARLSWSNLQGLCKSHHSAKTVREKR